MNASYWSIITNFLAQETIPSLAPQEAGPGAPSLPGDIPWSGVRQFGILIGQNPGNPGLWLAVRELPREDKPPGQLLVLPRPWEPEHFENQFQTTPPDIRLILLSTSWFLVAGYSSRMSCHLALVWVWYLWVSLWPHLSCLIFLWCHCVHSSTDTA